MISLLAVLSGVSSREGVSAINLTKRQFFRQKRSSTQGRRTSMASSGAPVRWQRLRISTASHAACGMAHALHLTAASACHRSPSWIPRAPSPGLSRDAGFHCPAGLTECSSFSRFSRCFLRRLLPAILLQLAAQRWERGPTRSGTALGRMSQIGDGEKDRQRA